MGENNTIDFSSVLKSAGQYPLTPDFAPRYGTSGFRGPSSKLKGIVFRVGVLTALRCLKTKSDCGLMITGSHNPVDDNGVKIVDFNGELLDSSWEIYAEQLCNAQKPEEVVKVCEEICQKENIVHPSSEFSPFEVFVGHDTRPSSPRLLDIAVEGIQSLKCKTAFEPGLHATPQVHFRVWRKYHGLACGRFQWLKYLAGGYMRMARGTKGEHGKLLVDCANGVAASILTQLGNCPGAIPQGYRFNLMNTGEGVLNEKCGSDFVQKTQSLPAGFGDIIDWQRCASVDGDVDRVVYFTRVSNTVLVLDGDRIAALAALHITELLEANKDFKTKYAVGVVLTAYSNSGLKKYLEKLGVKYTVVPTGVKHLHTKAKEYDIGIYYEANGHGSILFGKELSEILRETEDKPNKQPSDFELLAVLDTMNQAMGDGVSNILFVEAVLRQKKWSMKDWLDLYETVPTAYKAIPVKDKSKVKVSPDESVCLGPEKLKVKIDEIVARGGGRRVLVRPSGTEEVVRVFAESPSQDDAEKIVEELIEIVKQI